MHVLRFGLLAVLGLLALGCDGTISVLFSTGPQEFEVSTDALALPMELRDMSGTIASVPCGPMGMCPPSDEVTLDCNAGVCDPAPRTVSVPVGGVIDTSALLAETGDIGLNVIESFSIEVVTYDISLNTLTVPINEIEVFWGPEAATSIDPSQGVHPFGRIPAIGAGATSSGNMIIDGPGTARLSDFLVPDGGRLRLFARTMVDLDPGDPYPEGSVRMSVNATIRAVGSLVAR